MRRHTMKNPESEKGQKKKNICTGIEESHRPKEFVNVDIWGVTVDHKGNCKKKNEDISLNSKKQRIPVKKCRDRNKWFDSDKEEGEC